MGDAAGIGPEVAARSVRIIKKFCAPLVICDAVFFTKEASKFGIDISGAELLDLKNINNKIKPGRVSAAAGAAAAEYIAKAAELVLSKEASAMVTAPINKESLNKAGLNFPGHTEMLAKLTGAGEFAMMLAGGGLRVVLATTHTSLRNVPRLITARNVFSKISLTREWLKKYLKLRHPRIGVAGLNPHAGDGGLFGDEEKKEIIPAIKLAERRFGKGITGPVAPDILLYKAKKGHFDAVLCMYHDQGLVALKMEAFEKGVNITLGLPIIRTSPDHGTAYDIAGRGAANPESFIEAVKTAVFLAEQA